MLRIFVSFGVLAGSLYGQTYPLEAVVITGTTVPEATVMEMAGLTRGMAVDKGAIEKACAKLGDSGLFADVQYQYKEGAKKGFVVTLSVVDQPGLTPATIDVPGVDEAEVWTWLAARFPAFDHKVPGAGAAQDYLAHEVERHLAGQLHGHHMVSQMETEMGPHGGSILSFRPDVLPQITALKFTGEHEVSEAELREMMLRVVGTDGYMERRFRSAVDLNLRGLYEQHGMYRVAFPGVKMEVAGEDAVTVTTLIEEGPQYTLGRVQFSGEGVPADEMEKSAKFKVGEVANWREIDRSIDEAAGVLRRAGYLDASATPERVFDEQRHVLTLRVPVERGPLYRLGKVNFSGLTPEQEAKARLAWTAQTGAAFEARYPTEFYQAFGKTVDVRQFKKWRVAAKKLPGHVVDLEIAFGGS